MTRQEVLRAYRFALDPTAAQTVALVRYAGAARWAFNHALAIKQAAHQRWRAEVHALVESGTSAEEARKKAKIAIPSKPAIQKAWVVERGDSRRAPWYGATLIILPPGEPVNKICSRCGAQNARVTVSDSRIACRQRGLDVTRQRNAARNIMRAGRWILGYVTSGNGETINARGDAVRPHAYSDVRRAPLKREDIGSTRPDATPRE
ncbi:helix-turn-helix domain-containing protein [Streptomyces sp. TP-A0356]|uniref:helix-turn-helix domain-containing protein n=1 Tax=Streptomyces sp. TP-A0356 TaxID=1359208 RepID=UPI00099E7225|nr:helix-turn-helix domain-containing protein [Streptomyces sp. TP-A0356]